MLIYLSGLSDAMSIPAVTESRRWRAHRRMRSRIGWGPSLHFDAPGVAGVSGRRRSGSDVEGRDLVVHEREAPDGVVVGVGDEEVVALQAEAGRFPEGCIDRLAVLEAVAVSRHRLG